MTGSVWSGAPGNVLTSKLVKELCLSDLVTSLTVIPEVAYFRVYAAFRVMAIYLSLLDVSTSGVVTVDINRNGVSIFTTRITIDANELDSTTAAAYVLVGSPAPSFVDFIVGDLVTFDIDTAGTNAKGLIAYLVGFDT